MRRRVLVIVSIILISACFFMPAQPVEDRGQPSPHLKSLKHITALPVAKAGLPKYDVIVYGGDPEAIAAAVAAARNGATTLMIVPQKHLGGLFTLGELNILDLSHDIRGHDASGGIFQEWHRMVGGGLTFEIKDAEDAFTNLIFREPNITCYLDSRIINVDKQGETLESVTVQSEQGESVVQAKRFIDATPDADLAAMAGVPYFLGEADMGEPGRFMAATLVMHFSHVRWKEIEQTAYSHKFGHAFVRRNYAYGFRLIPKFYHPSEPNTKVRGMDIALMKDGSVFINAMQLFDVNGLNAASKAEAMRRGANETRLFLAFLQKNFPGFEQAHIADFPKALYIRETRHIRALYQLSILDVWENSDQWDSIGIASYAVDMQATKPDEDGYVVVQPKQYAIPFRSLIPLQADNLLVVGRSSGFSSLAAGSARVVPTGMVCGQAAGTAAAMSISLQDNFPRMSGNKQDVHLLQLQLQREGANLYHFHLGYPDENTWFSPYLLTLLPYGVVVTDYRNRLDETGRVSVGSFDNLLAQVVSRYNRDLYYRLAKHVDLWSDAVRASSAQTITRDQALHIETRFMGMAADTTWQEAAHEGFIDPILQRKLGKEQKLTRVECYALIADDLRYLQTHEFGASVG